MAEHERRITDVESQVDYLPADDFRSGVPDPLELNTGLVSSPGTADTTYVVSCHSKIDAQNCVWSIRIPSSSDVSVHCLRRLHPVKGFSFC